MAFNPVSNPNPEHSRPKTGVLSQGHDGNIRPDTATELPSNVRWAPEEIFGDDKC